MIETVSHGILLGEGVFFIIAHRAPACKYLCKNTQKGGGHGTIAALTAVFEGLLPVLAVFVVKIEELQRLNDLLLTLVEQKLIVVLEVFSAPVS